MTESTAPVGGDAGEGEHERNWFIRTKLTAPVHQVRLVPREHLLTGLDRLLGKRLGLIVAPAGFGKTTILMQWQARQKAAGTAVAWLTLDEGDGDIHQFLSYIVLALASVGVDLGSLEAAPGYRPAQKLLLQIEDAHSHRPN